MRDFTSVILSVIFMSCFSASMGLRPTPYRGSAHGPRCGTELQSPYLLNFPPTNLSLLAKPLDFN